MFGSTPTLLFLNSKSKNWTLKLCVILAFKLKKMGPKSLDLEDIFYVKFVAWGYIHASCLISDHIVYIITIDVMWYHQISQ